MHIYWSKRTKDKDGKIKLKEEKFRETLKKLKKENPAPMKRPERNLSFI